ncbi:MAG: hypothetical protein V3U31_06600, partial [Dehalococcoidia bacterium]
MELRLERTLMGEVGEVFARYYLRRRGFYPVLKPMWIEGQGSRLLPSAGGAINPNLWECSGRFTDEQKDCIFRYPRTWDYVAFGPGTWGKQHFLIEVKTSMVRRRPSKDRLP